MKVIISERQYKFLKEQKKEIDYSTGSGSYYGTYGYDEKGQTEWTKLDQHTKMEILAFGAAFIPVVGPFISASIGLSDAKLYYDEGDKKTAGITAAFSLLPFVGSVVSKIPGVKQLGTKGMAALASKLSKGNKELSKVELEVVNTLRTNESTIKQELNAAGKTLGGLTNSINQFRPQYIKRFGQQKYDELLQNLLSNKTTKEEFIISLKSSNPNKLVSGSTRGIRMSAKELQKIDGLASKIKNGEYFDEVIEIEVNGKKVKALVTSESMPIGSVGYVEKTIHQGHYIDNVHINADYLKTWSLQDVKKSLYHELSHAKDVGSKGGGEKFLDKAIELKDKADNLKLKTPKGNPLPKEYDELMSKAKEFYKKYQFSPEEFIANNQMIINNIVSKSNNFIKRYGKINGKDKITKMLDNIIDYTKSNQPLSRESSSLFSKEGLEYLKSLYSYDKKMYQQFLKKMTSQIQDLRLRLN